jgi:hypothetical protein
MLPAIAALLGVANALTSAYKFVHDNWGVIGPVVMNIEQFAADKLPGVKKAEIAVAALAPVLPEFKAMTPELKQAFDTTVKVAKLTASAVTAVQGAPGKT